jgi:outer membrane protein assembly factor BamA
LATACDRYFSLIFWTTRSQLGQMGNSCYRRSELEIDIYVSFQKHKSKLVTGRCRGTWGFQGVWSKSNSVIVCTRWSDCSWKTWNVH